MSKKELCKRYLLFISSLFFIGIGIALAKHADLGISPISSVPNVLHIKFGAESGILSFGSFLFYINMLMLLAQIIILRKRFQLIQLLQIPLSLIYGKFTDLAMIPIKHIPVNIGTQIAMICISVTVLGFAIALGVIANVLLNSPEALMKVISDVTKKNYGDVKVVFDVCWVAFAAVLALIFGGGSIKAIGIGTLIIALSVGFMVKLFKKLLEKPLTKILTK